jgi:hypothetical protein
MASRSPAQFYSPQLDPTVELQGRIETARMKEKMRQPYIVEETDTMDTCNDRYIWQSLVMALHIFFHICRFFMLIYKLDIYWDSNF